MPYQRDPDAGPYSERTGHYLGEINALHPFREGNGRAQRAFIGQVAREAGYEIEWSKISREDMIRGSIESFYGDSDKLAKLVQDNLASQKKDPLKFYYEQNAT